MFKFFGCCEPKQDPKVEAQGLFDTFKLTDKEVIDKVISVIKAIDVEKIKLVMNALEVDKDGWIRVKIDLGIKKE